MADDTIGDLPPDTFRNTGKMPASAVVPPRVSPPPQPPKPPRKPWVIIDNNLPKPPPPASSPPPASPAPPAFPDQDLPPDYPPVYSPKPAPEPLPELGPFPGWPNDPLADFDLPPVDPNDLNPGTDFVLPGQGEVSPVPPEGVPPELDPAHVFYGEPENLPGIPGFLGPGDTVAPLGGTTGINPLKGPPVITGGAPSGSITTSDLPLGVFSVGQVPPGGLFPTNPNFPPGTPGINAPPIFPDLFPKGIPGLTAPPLVEQYGHPLPAPFQYFPIRVIGPPPPPPPPPPRSVYVFGPDEPYHPLFDVQPGGGLAIGVGGGSGFSHTATSQ